MDNKTILIVDDTYENLYLLRVILEEAGFNVIEANNGSEGLKQLHANNKVDLIISDILMPIMDGYLFCQACKKEKLFKKIPFVFYTSTYTEKLDEDFGLKLGASKFLRKPIDHDELLFIVNDIFDTARNNVKYVKKVRINEGEVLKLYSERLINKLEQKSLDLGNEVLERKKTEQLLIQKNEILDLIAVNTPLNKIFDRLLLNYESNHSNYFGALSLMDDDGIHLDLISAPSMPKPFNQALKRGVISENAGSCGTAAFTKKAVIVSDISKDKLWVDYKDIALKHNLRSCWSLPILSKTNSVLGTFAIYSNSISTPSLEDIRELNFAVSLANIAIEKAKIVEENKKKDESYKALIDQANDAIITYTFEGDIYDFNRAAYTNLGYTKSEFSKLKIQDLILGPIVENPETQKKILQGDSLILNRQFKRKDGSVLDVEISIKLQKDGKILGIARDITERKLVEKKLVDSEYNLKQSQIVASIGSFTFDFNSMTWESSSILDEILGINKSFVKSFESWSSLIHPDEREKLLIYFENNILKRHEKFNKEYRILRADNNKEVWVHGIGELVFDSSGKPMKMIGTAQDITERKQSEIALKAAKEFTDKLVMSMQEGLLIVDLEGKIMRVNNSLCEILGYSNKELVGLNLPYPFARTEDLKLMLEIKEDVAKGEAKSFQLEFTKKNGEKFTASFLSGNIKNDKGEVIALFGTVKDVSEEDKVKSALEETAKKSILKKEVILELAGFVGGDFELALKKITFLAAKTLDVERVGIWKFNSNKTEIVCLKGYDLKTQSYFSDTILTDKENPNYFEALLHKNIISVEDALNNNITKGFAKDFLIPIGITSMMDVFIQSANGNYGVICFEHVGPKRKWTAEEEEFATSIANLVSLMVESHERKLVEDKLVASNDQLSNANTELNVLRAKLKDENIYLRNELDLVFNFEEMVYGSAVFSQVLTDVEKVAVTDATVLLMGETGTGKELLARAVHNISLRKERPLIKINCAAIPKELIESELFGHKKGSFTGAFSDKVGKFELADGGTLFLDEIGELPIDMQPKLLRFLQEGEIEKIGGTVTKKLDVRIIAATNKNLKEEVDKKLFREDLFFRINVFPIRVPSLSERKEDIPLLVEHFVHKYGKRYGKTIKFISEASIQKMQAYKWPGNIRELENLIERAVILSTGESLVFSDFSTSNTNDERSISATNLSLNDVQRNHILKILNQCNWKIDGENGASEILDIKPSTLRDRMKKLEIKKP